jgi:hypothetical protein
VGKKKKANEGEEEERTEGITEDIKALCHYSEIVITSNQVYFLLQVYFSRILPAA